VTAYLLECLQFFEPTIHLIQPRRAVDILDTHALRLPLSTLPPLLLLPLLLIVAILTLRINITRLIAIIPPLLPLGLGLLLFLTSASHLHKLPPPKIKNKERKSALPAVFFIHPAACPNLMHLLHETDGKGSDNNK